MRAELANLDQRAVPFLSRAATNLCWYYSSARARRNHRIQVPKI